MIAAEDLRADCANCFGLCCAALPFARSADFAFDKAAGSPCRHLGADFGCGIHDRLRPAGMPGCTVYDCFGAGQRVARMSFGGRDWRAEPDSAGPMFAAFTAMRQLHELLWYLSAALIWEPARPVFADLQAAVDDTERLARDVLAAPDVAAHRARVAPLLRRASALVRGSAGADRAGADLIGADLRGDDLRRADLRNACLIGADLRGVDLGLADLIGADLRDADLCRADVSTALFVTQPQLNAARGDGATRIPASLERPPHWR